MDSEGTHFLMPPKIEAGFDPIQAKHREDKQAVFGAICEVMQTLNGIDRFSLNASAG